MWCRHCGQDTPSLPTAEGGLLACARCGQSVGPPRRTSAPLAAASLHGIDLSGGPRRGSARPSVAAPAAESFPADDAWDLGQEVRRLRAKFPSPITPNPLTAAAPPGSELAGLGSAALLQMAWPPAGQPAHAPPPPRARVLVWAARLSGIVGLAALGAGGSLLAASAMFGQAALWRPGLLTVAGGHVALAIGLLLWLAQIGRRSREAVERLACLDHRLRDLHQSTQLLGATRGSAAQAFYAHLAEGASPNLLLADLKGQLDLLAVRLTQRQG